MVPHRRRQRRRPRQRQRKTEAAMGMRMRGAYLLGWAAAGYACAWSWAWWMTWDAPWRAAATGVWRVEEIGLRCRGAEVPRWLKLAPAPLAPEAVVVLGYSPLGPGGAVPRVLERRLRAAQGLCAERRRQGHDAAFLVLSGGVGDGAGAAGVSEARAMRGWLEAHGGAEGCGVVVEEQASTSTRENAGQVAALLRGRTGGRGPAQVTVVTSGFHERRAHLTFAKEFSGGGVAVRSASSFVDEARAADEAREDDAGWRAVAEDAWNVGREVAAAVLYAVRGDLALGRWGECDPEGIGPAGEAIMAQVALAVGCERGPEGTDAKGILDRLDALEAAAAETQGRAAAGGVDGREEDGEEATETTEGDVGES